MMVIDTRSNPNDRIVGIYTADAPPDNPLSKHQGDAYAAAIRAMKGE